MPDRARPTLWCVDDDVPPETVQLLAAAADARGIGIRVVRPGHDPADAPADGDLLFRPAVSAAAVALERALYRPTLRTFWRRADWAWTVPAFPPAVLAHAGVPVPPTVGLHTTDRPRLRALAAQVGGPPWVVKVPGSAGGYGVFRVGDLAGLFGLADFLVGEGHAPLLMPWIDGVHWRVVVVGDRAVAAYRNPIEPDDFRTVGGVDAEDLPAEVPTPLAAPAVAACRALGVAHGGVDLLWPEGGGPVVLECNFPCYFPHAQRHGGVDVAGAMVDLLLAADPPKAPVAAPWAPATERRVLVVDGTTDPTPFLEAAGGPVELIDARSPPPDPLEPGDALLQIGLSTAAFRVAARLAAPGVRALPRDPSVEPAVLAMVWDQGPWPPPVTPGAPAALAGRAAVVGPLSRAQAETAAGADAALRVVAWRPDVVAWRLTWIGEALVEADRADAPGGGWPEAGFEPAAPPPGVVAAARAWAARAGWRWLRCALLVDGDRAHLHALALPPDLAESPRAARVGHAAALWSALLAAEA